MTIYNIFAENIEEKAVSTAIYTSGGVRLSYAEANKCICRWAHYLISQNVQSGDRVAVMVRDEDLQLFICIALSMIGAVYAPFEAGTPNDKITYAVASLDFKKFFIDKELLATYQFEQPTPSAIQVIAPEQIAHSEEYLPDAFNPVTQSLQNSYIFFSSGRTGFPKAIFAGKGMAYWGDVITKTLGPYNIKKILVTRGPGFDARIFEYLIGLSLGAELHLLEQNQRKELV